MRIIELFEGLSPVLYHITSLQNAANILDTDEFHLRPMFTSSEKRVGDKNKLYFMSTSRFPYGDFQRSKAQVEKNLLVLFELDGKKLAHNYAGEPVEFFSSKKYRTTNRLEHEDRVYSDKPFIPNAKKYITGVHVLLVPERLASDGISKTQAHFLRVISTSGVPVHYYGNYPDFLHLRNASQKMPPLHVNKDWRGVNPEYRQRYPKVKDFKGKVTADKVAMLIRLPVDQFDSLTDDDKATIRYYVGGLFGTNVHYFKSALESSHEMSNPHDQERLASAMRSKKIKSINGIISYLKNKWGFLHENS